MNFERKPPGLIYCRDGFRFLSKMFKFTYTCHIIIYLNFLYACLYLLIYVVVYWDLNKIVITTIIIAVKNVHTLSAWCWMRNYH